LQDLESAVQSIQQGDEGKREELIATHKNFIHKYTCFICKNPLSWHNDDELSIALIAFNKAIDTFDCKLNKTFSSYAKILIKNSLIDYFRRQQVFRPVSINTATMEAAAQSPAEVAASWNSYLQDIENRNRAYEIQIFEQSLEKIGLSLEELVKCSPLHNDTREKIKDAARKIAVRQDLATKLHQNKKLPLTEMQLLTGVKKKTLQKWRKYLLSLIIILTSDELETLAEYIWEGGGLDQKS
jgi:RNA polymerase sigma factor